MRENFHWVEEDNRLFLERDYLLEGVSIEQRTRQISDYAESLLGIEGYSDRLYYHIAQGYLSLSSPIWSNFGLERGLPISCFGSYIGDSVEEILEAVTEIGIMSKVGGGTSGYFGHIRHRGASITNNGESNGTIPFLRVVDTTVDVISQGSTRRGYFAGYIDIEHKDIEEWLEIGLEGNEIQNIYYGVCVGDEWIEEMKAGDKKKRKIWAKVLQNRAEIGVPYIFFKDTVNNNAVDIYRDKGCKILASNLCTEITLPSTKDESFVCDLAATVARYYEDWKDTDLIEVSVFLLDAVMTDFINKGKKIKHLERAVRFAENHRALGLGTLGWHDLLQSKMIAFDSFEAMQLNNEFFKNLKEKAYDASKKLAHIFGECPMTKGYGRRNTTLLTIAPNKSSGFIVGKLEGGIGVKQSNYTVKDLAKIKVTVKNPYLADLLRLKDRNTADVWDSILLKDGSVMHLDFLTDEEKNVFRTFSETSQLAIIQQAAQRQKYLCQSQSLNLMIHPNTPTKDVNSLYLTAHELGVKTLYYQYSVNAAQELNRELLTCSSCDA